MNLTSLRARKPKYASSNGHDKEETTGRAVNCIDDKKKKKTREVGKEIFRIRVSKGKT